MVPRQPREITTCNIEHRTSEPFYKVNVYTDFSTFVTSQPALLIPTLHFLLDGGHRTMLLNIDHKRGRDAQTFP